MPDAAAHAEMEAATPTDYVLGHSRPEIERLKLQAEAIGGVTGRLIRDCGIGAGMSVVEFGCGAGDVSFLLAEAVGAAGAVLAFDREPLAIEAARIRAADRSLTRIEFAVMSEDEIPASAFDAAFGRYVLIHQPDPVRMLRRAAASVRSGGIVAFHEVALHREGHTDPPVDLYRKLQDRYLSAFRALLPGHDVAGRFMASFEDAGLPRPSVTWESVVGDHSSVLPRWLVATYRSMLPRIVALGLDPLGDPERLSNDLTVALEAARAQIVSIPQVCAWSVGA